MSKSIAIFGGSGFLGRKICEVGIGLGYQVTSFSRSGKPPSINEAWVDEVEWVHGDIFKPESYKEKLKGKSAVVHSIGLILENQGYKKSMNSNFNFLSDLQNLASSLKGPNPMKKDRLNTYEAIQRDSAVILADAYLEQQKEDPTFVYISADQKIPIIPEGYINTKREAEFELSCKKDLRSIFMRPGVLYNESDPPLNNRRIFTQFVGLGYDIKNTLLGNNIDFINQLVRPPCSTEQVATKMFAKIEDKDASGVVLLDEIRK